MVLKCWLNWESKLKQQEIFTCNDEKVGCDNTASEKSAIFLTNDRQGLGAISIFANTALWDWYERLKERQIKKIWRPTGARNICMALYWGSFVSYIGFCMSVIR